ncbi:hypothetical protein [Chelativorans sp. AA-79]|uniref:hypothetical protein n=1 Tax=Chelativorans sp. AA-79 TaxID=3028735 RepID=UPI0023F977A5|nr:hypothetical protein [Chelativorans sp. AA-79]WEX07516.1 hypothetical protein PVE73_15480 [Chelativorans sp. AA-79]
MISTNSCATLGWYGVVSGVRKSSLMPDKRLQVLFSAAELARRKREDLVLDAAEATMEAHKVEAGIVALKRALRHERKAPQDIEAADQARFWVEVYLKLTANRVKPVPRDDSHLP